VTERTRTTRANNLNFPSELSHVPTSEKRAKNNSLKKEREEKTIGQDNQDAERPIDIIKEMETD
jgi:hypothetical protein